MLLLRRPDETWMTRLFRAETNASFSYPEVGATREQLPPHYNVNQAEASLGTGAYIFDRAKAAIQAWVPFRVPWLCFYAKGPLSEGILVAVVVHRFGLWWVNLNRIIYVIDEPNRFGFAYGTLGHHALSGEELFLVERSPESGEVTYRIFAFSRPRHLLTRLGYPLTRAAQHQFGVDSIQAMQSVFQSSECAA